MNHPIQCALLALAALAVGALILLTMPGCKHGPNYDVRLAKPTDRLWRDDDGNCWVSTLDLDSCSIKHEELFCPMWAKRVRCDSHDYWPTPWPSPTP